MRYAVATVTALVLTVALSGCSQKLDGGGGGEKKGTIVVYRDEGNVCKTVTTPFFKAFKSRGKVEWKIDDEFDCVVGGVTVKIVFDKPGYPDIFPKCDKEDTKKIDCSLEGVAPTRTKYSVYLGSTKTEDPELQIEI